MNEIESAIVKVCVPACVYVRVCVRACLCACVCACKQALRLSSLRNTHNQTFLETTLEAEDTTTTLKISLFLSNIFQTFLISDDGRGAVDRHDWRGMLLLKMMLSLLLWKVSMMM